MSGLSSSGGNSIDDGTSPAATSSISVGASPFTHQHTGSRACDVIVQGGTVSLIEFSRDGTTFFTTGLTAGMFGLSVGDRIRVTYSVAPTMTKVPR